jgi:DNA-binding Lrp family transcriptional regulator
MLDCPDALAPAGTDAGPGAHRLDLDLLNRFQRDFPLVPRPFLQIARSLGRRESTVLQSLRRLAASGAVSRVGAVFAPQCAGASTLAALSAPPERLERIAGIVSSFAQVNHNYERESPLNLWFVAAAASEPQLAALLEELSQRTGCEVLRMPLEREFHIDLGFDLAFGRGFDSCGAGAGPAARDRATATPVQARTRPWSADERRLQHALQDGLALVPHPYRELAARAGLAEADVLSGIGGWVREGVIRRLGVVVRHHELGYTANAMCVWDVPDAVVDALAARVAAAPWVTLCYRRGRAGARWPFNLYCMVHGRRRAEVAAHVQALAQQHGLGRFRSEVLYTRRRFKQQGARYLHDGGAGPGNGSVG